MTKNVPYLYAFWLILIYCHTKSSKTFFLPLYNKTIFVSIQINQKNREISNFFNPLKLRLTKTLSIISVSSPNLGERNEMRAENMMDAFSWRFARACQAYT